jgi:hypothetical protein
MADDKPKPSRVKAIAAKLTQKPAASSEPPPSWVGYVAMLTGILAGTAGFLTVRATTLTNNAIYESNQAILEQAQASDSWNEYQADSIKSRIIETSIAAAGAALDAPGRAGLEAQDKDFRDRQPKIQADAKAHEASRDAHLAQGQGLLATRDLISYADLATQLGIALASVAAMVRVRRAFDGAIVIGGLGVIIAIYALGRQYLGVM